MWDWVYTALSSAKRASTGAMSQNEQRAPALRVKRAQLNWYAAMFFTLREDGADDFGADGAGCSCHADNLRMTWEARQRCEQNKNHLSFKSAGHN